MSTLNAIRIRDRSDCDSVAGLSLLFCPFANGCFRLKWTQIFGRSRGIDRLWRTMGTARRMRTFAYPTFAIQIKSDNC
jgi:hypothetical protein